MKVDIKKDRMSPMFNFLLKSDPGTCGLEGRKRNLGKHLEWRDRDET